MKLRSKTRASAANTASTGPAQNTASQLLAVLSQHEMLTALCENLSSADIVHLGATCKEAKTYVLDSHTIFQQLKGNAICDGRGLVARQRVFGHDVRGDTCLAGSERPCTDCGAMVCDQCRFHILYDYLTLRPSLDAEEVKSLLDEEHKMAEILLEIGHDDYINDTRDLATYIEANKACEMWRNRLKRFCKAHHPLSLTDFNKQHPCCGATDRSQVDGGFFEHFVGNRWLCLPCFFLEETKTVEESQRKVLGHHSHNGSHWYTRRDVCECGQLAHENSSERCKYCGHGTGYFIDFERKEILPAILQQLGHEKKEEGDLAEICAQLG